MIQRPQQRWVSTLQMRASRGRTWTPPYAPACRQVAAARIRALADNWRQRGDTGSRQQQLHV